MFWWCFCSVANKNGDKTLFIPSTNLVCTFNAFALKQVAIL